MRRTIDRSGRRMSIPGAAVKGRREYGAMPAEAHRAATRTPRQLNQASLLHATDALAKADPDLGAIVAEFGPPPLWARRPGFATLVRIILEQQVSLAAAKTMYERLDAHASGVTPDAIAALGEPGLRRLGFTRQKAQYSHGLAVAVRDGALDLGGIARAGDGDGMSRLLAMRGLGPWSVDIYYLMALRRPDVWPRGDLALAIAVHRVKRMRARPDYAALTRFAERWAPWRSVAARILWHHYLSRPR
jgi:DNA-3-methyladenine glycosylase II